MLCSLFSIISSAQNNPAPSCLEQHLHEKKMQDDPLYKATQDRLEERTYQQMLRKNTQRLLEKNNTNCNTGNDGGNSNESIPIIPVVVHVLHSSEYPNPNNSSNNPSDEQINRAIEYLNDAFRNRRAYSGDGRAANDPRNPDRALMRSQDIRVEFRLAQRNRFNRSVSGIMRYETDEYARLDINLDDQMKRWVANQNNNAFPTTQYVNVYIVSQICDGNPSTSRECGVAGYAYLAGSHGRPFDGIVNEMRYFGTGSTSSKVHIHEFGHYFNLRHTFQGGCGGSNCLATGDLVCDTPADDENRGLSCGANQNSCSQDVNAGFFSIDQGDMYENYMDYFTISCQNTFTQGQKDRMRSALFGIRSSLLSSKGAIPVGSTLAAINEIAAPKGIACDASIQPQVEIENKGDRSINSMKIQYELGDGTPRFYDWTGNIAARSIQRVTLPNIDLNTIGRYDLFVQILEVNGAAADVSVDAFCQSFQYAPALTQLPYCQSIVENTVPIEWAVENPDNDVAFETTRIDGCETRERYAFVLETWGKFPDQTTKDEIYTQAIDLSNYDAAYFDFDVAYASTFPNFNTILDVAVSTDCGANYRSVYNKTGDVLATTRVQAQNSTDESAAFEPTDCAEWRKESIDLSTYAGQKINIRIQASTAQLTNSTTYEWGNNLYLDNFCLNFERCSAPIPTTDAEISICRNLEVDAQVENLSESKDVFWWITSNNPITNIISNQQVLESAVGFTPLGDASGLSGQGNIIFRANQGTAALSIPVDCDLLKKGTTYYATPLILNADLSNPFFDDCTFGRSVAFTCDCSNACALKISEVSVEDANNCGVNNGAIIVEVNEAESAEYSLNGQNWQRNKRFAGLAAGTYTVFVRTTNDASCQLSSSNIVVNEPSRPEINEVIVQAPSCESEDGSIEIRTNSEIETEYRLDNGAWQSNPIFTNLAVGNYTLSIRNKAAVTCATTRSVELLALPKDDIRISNIESISPSACGAADGRLIITSDADDVEYSIDGGITWQSENSFEDLSAGTYFPQIRSGICSFFEGEALTLTSNGTGIAAAIELVESKTCLNQENEFFFQITGGTAPYSIRYQSGQREFLVEAYQDEEILTFTPTARISILKILTITDADFCEVESGKSIVFQASRCSGNLEMEEEIFARHIKLYPNQPNPFQNSTLLHFDLPQQDQVILTIYSAAGKMIYQEGRKLEAGYHQWRLGSKDLSSTGVFYYSLETSEERVVEKMVRVE